MATFLSVAPHPDDEVLGAGPVSLSLLDAGHDVHVLCLSLGRPDDRDRRRAEVTAAAEVGGWTLHLPDDPYDLGRNADPSVEAALGRALAGWATELDVDVVIGPGPHDAHHGHEVVGRAVRDGCVAVGGLRWWAWQVWGHLPVVDLVHPFDEAVAARALDALARHGGELARNDYTDMLLGAARLAAATGAERLLGFGAARRWTPPYASLLCGSLVVDGGWYHTFPRVLDPSDPLAGDPDPARDASWLDAPSPYR